MHATVAACMEDFDRSIFYALQCLGCATVTLKLEQRATAKSIYEGKYLFLRLPTGFAVQFLPDANFDISVLEMFDTCTGTDIFREIAPKCQEFIGHVWIQPGWAHQSWLVHSPIERTKRVFQEWLDSGDSLLHEHVPATWKMLFRVLRGMELAELAQQIEDWLRMVPQSTVAGPEHSSGEETKGKGRQERSVAVDGSGGEEGALVPARESTSNAAPCPAELSTEPELRDLMNLVAANIPSKWRLVGIQLHLNDSELNTIEMISNEPLRCFSSVFTLWKRKETILPLSWWTVLQTLQAASVGEKRLARKVRKKLTTHSDN